MKRLKFGFRNKTAQEQLDICERTIKNVAAQPAEYLVNVDLPEVQSVVAATRASHDRIASLRIELKSEISRRNSLLSKARTKVQAAAGFAALGMNEDTAKMLSLGLPLHSEKHPVGKAGAPTYFTAKPTDGEGEALLRWKRPVRLCSFDIEMKADPLNRNQWKRLDSSLKQKCLVKDLESGMKYWFRVRACNAHGDGPWSELASVRPK